MRLHRPLVAFALGVFAVATLGPGVALAHRDGCHRWHSCPSDTGSYTCGDLGYSAYCPGAARQPTPVPTGPRPGPGASSPMPSPTPRSGPSAPPAAARGCGFQLGFEAIQAQIPDMVGVCLEDEHFNAANGNAEQRTAAHHGQGGLLVWRKADNWTAFTDGYWTWVNGPYGLMKRLNTERFDWEAP